VQRLTALGVLLIRLAVGLIVVVPLESAWKWPVVILLLVIGFILMFVGVAQRPRSSWGASSQLGGEDGPFNMGTPNPRHHRKRFTADSDDSSFDAGDAGGGGDGGGD
jgi:hypothetical protein